jgi:ABC-type transport system involved in Fe-S cluster assembly fused permease/ATPase subunit
MTAARLLFQVVPIFIDIGVAIIFFAGVLSRVYSSSTRPDVCATVTFGPILAIVLAFVMVAYVYSSVKLTQVRVKLRREMNDKDKVSEGFSFGGSGKLTLKCVFST